MKKDKGRSQCWKGKHLGVCILYSRAGVAQHIWIETKNSRILIDAGDGIVRDLLSNELDPLELDGVFFTHGHFDHMGGLHSLFGYLRMVGRKKMLHIYVPKGCSEVLSVAGSFPKLYTDTMPFEISLKEIDPNGSFKIGNLTFEAFPMIHCGSIDKLGILDPIPALGYRISCGDETVAITGDCGTKSPLRELVRGADLAIIEATYQKSEKISKELLERVHLSEDIATELGRLAKQFILVHKGGTD